MKSNKVKKVKVVKPIEEDTELVNMIDKKYVKFIKSAHNGGYVRGMTAKDAVEMQSLLKDLSGEFYPISQGCGHCYITICNKLYKYI